MGWRRFFSRFRRSTPQEVPLPSPNRLAVANAEVDHDTSGIVHQLGDPDPNLRRHAAEALSALGRGATIAVPEIVSLFQHPDPNVRRDAIMAVGQIGRSGIGAAPKLIESLADTDAGVRRMARIAILQVDPGANTLLEALTRSDWKIRESAAHALPRVVRLDPPPVDNLVAHLADDAPGDGQKIIETLVSIGGPAISALTKALDDVRLCHAAVASLAKMGKVAVPAIGPLTEFARSRGAVSAVEAVHALGGIGLEAIPALISLLDSEGCVSSAAMAMLATMRAAAAPAISSLTQLAYRKDRALAVEAVRTLGAIGPAAIPPLVRLLDEEDLDSLVVQPTEFDRAAWTFGLDLSRRETVTGEICNSLARMGSVAQLATLLRHPHAHVRKCAADALRTMYSQGEVAVPALVSALADPDGGVRRAATGALQSLLPGAEARLDTWLDAIQEQRGQLTRDTLRELASGEDELVVLLLRLKSGSAAVRRAASIALTEIIPALREVRVPNLFGSGETTFDYSTLTPETLTQLLRDQPYAFEFLSQLHLPDRTLNFRGLSQRGAEQLPELIAKVRDRQMLLAQAEGELATASVEQLEPATVMETEAQRYTDVAIYEGSLYPGDDLATAYKLPDVEPLVVGKSYTLEVAIRLKRTGIDAERDAPRSVRSPRQDKEDLTVYVLARPQWEGIEIEESLARITWPYNADSGVALFRFNARSVQGGDMSQGTIELRLYDRSLDLLDMVSAFVTVVPGDSERKRMPGVPARHLLWPDKEPGVPHIDPKSPPRLLSMNVTSVRQGYRFEFIFRERNGDVIKVPVVRDIRAADLDNLLIKVRDFWTDLVITNYSAQLSVARATFGKYISRLADLGVEAWSMLFGTRYADQSGASESLGELLASMELTEGTHVQITYSDAYSDFIFPWSILYPPIQDSSSAADPLRFWGARYQIEQVKAGPKRDALNDEPVSVLFALDPGFGNSDAQKELFEKYRAAAGDRLRITSPISDQQTLFKELVCDPSAHLLYFYCHGYASTRQGVLRPDGVQLLKRRIEAMPADSQERQALETLLTLTAKMGDESWMYVGGSEIKESKLKLQRFFEKRRPIVFLNMCQSADLVPSMSGGLVRVFLDHNASAVIGTESPMTAVFANAFGEAVLDGVFGGDDIGTALWKARRRFLGDDLRNPLGLAYTLYGRATARVGAIPLITAMATSNPTPVVSSNS